MKAWERRLKDLAQLHKQCSEVYFEPELFRMNSNQFLQTARTITFIIQKNKAQIPEFDNWYRRAVLDQWAQDALMTWAKDSRNQIEKRGHLELYSIVNLALVYSYDEKNDLLFEIPNSQLIMAGVKKLMRFARKNLPTGVSDSAVVKIERRWSASTLKDWELLSALSYVYARMYDLCASLAGHLGDAIDNSIPEPSILDLVRSDARKTRYLKLGDTGAGRIQYKRIKRDPNFKPPFSLVRLSDHFKEQGPLTCLEAAVERHLLVACDIFEQVGGLIQTVHLLDDEWKTIDIISSIPADQPEKYIFWREIEERILYLRAHALIFEGEAWIRDAKKYPMRAMRTLPMKGETLIVVGIEAGGKSISRGMKIIRDGRQNKPYLVPFDDENQELKSPTWNFMLPVKHAFEKLTKNSGY